jgi:hypothetical protein
MLIMFVVIAIRPATTSVATAFATAVVNHAVRGAVEP